MIQPLSYFETVKLAFAVMGILLIATSPIFGLFWLLDTLDIEPGWTWLITILLIIIIFDAATVTYLVGRIAR